MLVPGARSMWNSPGFEATLRSQRGERGGVGDHQLALVAEVEHLADDRPRPGVIAADQRDGSPIRAGGLQETGRGHGLAPPQRTTGRKSSDSWPRRLRREGVHAVSFRSARPPRPRLPADEVPRVPAWLSIAARTAAAIPPRAGDRGRPRTRRTAQRGPDVARIAPVEALLDAGQRPRQADSEGHAERAEHHRDRDRRRPGRTGERVAEPQSQGPGQGQPAEHRADPPAAPAAGVRPTAIASTVRNRAARSAGTSAAMATSPARTPVRPPRPRGRACRYRYRTRRPPRATPGSPPGSRTARPAWHRGPTGRAPGRHTPARPVPG